MTRFRSFRTRLQLALLALVLGAIGVTGWEASEGAAAALSASTYDRLTAIRATRARHIERYFHDLRTHANALASDELTISALEELGAAWNAVPVSDDRSQRAQELRQYYESVFAPRSGAPAAAWFPADPRTRTLQHIFIAANPRRFGETLLTAPEAGPYNRAHVRCHPTLQRYQGAFGFYDTFLIDLDGRVLYSVSKEIDLGVALREKPFDDSALRRAFEAAMTLKVTDSAAMEDYSFYAPSYFAPAAFVAAPVWRAGMKIGVLAIQVSINEVNKVMTGDRNWREEGLGETGQAYVVGADGGYRTDLRIDVEQLAKAGVDPKVIERIRHDRTAILHLRAAPALMAELRASEQGTRVGSDFRGVRVLRSHSHLHMQGLDWTLVAEIDEGEAFAPVAALRRRIFAIGALIAVVFLAAAAWLARSVTKPVLALEESARRLGSGQFDVRIPVESEDEIGRLAASFNRMAEDLDRTTVSKAEVDRTLAALIDAVLVVEFPRGVNPDDVRSGRIRQCNPAAQRLLRYDEAELTGLTFGQLLPASDAWRVTLQMLLDDGSAPPVEATLQPKSGAPIPVLFTAALLPESQRQFSGMVCAAQDITELLQKRIEAEHLAGRLINAQEEERRRLARELHDDVTQRVAAVAIEVGRLARGADERVRASLDRIKEDVANLSSEIHTLSRGLHPSMLEDLGLEAAIESEARSVLERGGPVVELNCRGQVESVPLAARLAVYRIFQEGVRNAHRHGCAEMVRVSIRRTADAIELEIDDDGQGFDRAHANWRPGVGLASMEERARLLGGSFAVRPAPGGGTHIRVRLPLEDTNAETDGPARG